MSVYGAAKHLLEQVDTYRTWEAGTHLTCAEVDAFAGLHLAAGDPESARAWLETHSEDKEGEAHHGVNTEEAYAAYLLTLMHNEDERNA